MFSVFSAWLALTCLSGILTAQSMVAPEPSARVNSDWHAQISEEIRCKEYAFHSLADAPGVWSAPNRSQELRSRVTREGLDVFSRQASADGVGAPWKLRLATDSFGRPGNTCELNLPTISARGSRIELDRGSLREWFENAEGGIEQGFTIATPPSGSGPLRIGIQFSGTLHLRIEDVTSSALLVDESGVVQLRYHDLVVFDAIGCRLPAELKSSPTGLAAR